MLLYLMFAENTQRSTIVRSRNPLNSHSNWVIAENLPFDTHVCRIHSVQ
jgi:hypothetical protein